jgi:hypothetical protein
MQSATPCLRPVLLLPRSLHSSVLRIACGREAGTSRSIVLLRTRLVSWPSGLALTSSTRSAWRYHVPPNLESQYRRERKACQEKNAKCGERVQKNTYL